MYVPLDDNSTFGYPIYYETISADSNGLNFLYNRESQSVNAYNVVDNDWSTGTWNANYRIIELRIYDISEAKRPLLNYLLANAHKIEDSVLGEWYLKSSLYMDYEYEETYNVGLLYSTNMSKYYNGFTITPHIEGIVPDNEKPVDTFTFNGSVDRTYYTFTDGWKASGDIIITIKGYPTGRNKEQLLHWLQTNGTRKWLNS